MAALHCTATFVSLGEIATHLSGNVWQIRPNAGAEVVEEGTPGIEASADEDVRPVQVHHAVLAEGLGQSRAEAEVSVLVDFSLPEDIAAAAAAPGHPPSRRLGQHHGGCVFPGHDEIGVPFRPYC